MPLPQTFSLLVLGQGSSGLDVVQWACSHLGDRVSGVTMYGGAKAQPNDRTRELERAGARFVFGTEDVEGAYDICVSSPGISEFSDFFAAGRAHSNEIMGEPEFAFRLSPSNWCAVTGTNGKTTTTSLVDHLLRFADISSVAVGNIGNPPINEVDGRADDSWFCAELSSYQIATTKELHPRVAILLNITDDHLAWHRTHENYAEAKIRLFQNMEERDLAIVDVEDEGNMAHRDEIFKPGRRVLSLSCEDGGADDAAFVRDGRMVVRLAGVENELVSTADLQIAGHHNVINALAAAAAALACGASAASVRAGLVNFAPLEHRIEPAGSIAGVRFYNDSKATNTDAVEKALTAFPRDRVILLLGGHDKGTPLEDFSRIVCQHVVAAVCFGEAAERFERALEFAGAKANGATLARAEHMRDAVDVARTLAHAGDVVLFSPACSSFDEFSGYEERGRAFKSYLDELRAADAAAIEG